MYTDKHFTHIKKIVLNCNMWKKAIDKQCKNEPRKASLPKLWCGLWTMVLYRGRQPLFQFFIDFRISWKYIEGIWLISLRKKKCFSSQALAHSFSIRLRKVSINYSLSIWSRDAWWRAIFNNLWSRGRKQDRRLLICRVKLCFKTLSLSHPLCTSALPRSLWRTNERGQLTKHNPTMQSF